MRHAGHRTFFHAALKYPKPSLTTLKHYDPASLSRELRVVQEMTLFDPSGDIINFFCQNIERSLATLVFNRNHKTRSSV